MIRLSTFVMLAVLASVGLALAIFLRRGDAALAVDVYLLTVGGLALLAVIGRTLGRLPREAPTRLDRRPAGPPAQARPRELVKLEREVGLATETAFDAHFRLRPTIRNIAATAPAPARRRPRCPRQRGAGAARPRGVGARPARQPAAARARRGRHAPGEDRRRRRSARSPVTIDEVAEQRPGAPGRGRARRRRQARGARARPPRAARRRPRADRGLPRAREDADRALVRAGDEPATSAGSSSRRI